LRFAAIDLALLSGEGKGARRGLACGSQRRSFMRPFLPFAFAAFAVLSACADSEPPEAVPTDGGGYNVVTPVKTPITDDAEPAIGQWIQSMQDEQPVLQFGPANTEPLFSIGCDARGGILLNRHGTVASDSGAMMTVTIGSETRNLAVNAAQGPLPRMRASVPAQDEMLAQLRQAQQPIRISMGDGPPLVLPVSPQIGEFIQGCGNPRAAPRPSPAAAPASDNGAAPAGNVQ
jgi:hypothetical protein